MNYKFIQVYTEDNIKLSGLVSQGDKEKIAHIFIHGFETDFYSHSFYHSITQKLTEQGNSCILTQHRGTGLYTEFIKEDGDGVYIGSFHEKIEDAHLDISAFVEYLLSKGFQKISLIGHSLGTIKAVRYLFEGKYKDKISSLVLLSPFDKNAWIHKKSHGKWSENLKIAEQKISSGAGDEIVPIPEWEDYPVTFNTYYSWYNQTDLSCIWDFYRKDYNFPILNQISIPVKVILGNNDEFMDFPEYYVSPKSALDKIKENIENSETVLLNGCDHVFLGFEEQLSEEIASFARKLS